MRSDFARFIPQKELVCLLTLNYTRLPNVFAYSETRCRDLTVPSICKERVSTVAKPELKVAVKISGIFRYINSMLYARNSGKNTPKIGLIMGTTSHKDAHVHCILH
jgi:hypothetical protein